MRKKLLIGVLSIAMVFCMMPTFVFADAQNTDAQQAEEQVQGELEQNNGDLEDSNEEAAKEKDESVTSEDTGEGTTLDQEGVVINTNDSQNTVQGTKVKASTTKQTVTSLLSFESTTPSVNHLSDYGYSWDQDTMTLTLSNFTSSAEEVIEMVDGGNIVLKGTNAMTNAKQTGICYNDDLSIKGERGAALNITLDEIGSTGICAGIGGTTLKIDGGLYSFTGGSDVNTTFALQGENMYFSNATFTMNGQDCAIWAGGDVSIINTKITARTYSRGIYEASAGAKVSILNSDINFTLVGARFFDTVGIDLKYIDGGSLNIKDSNVVVNNQGEEATISPYIDSSIASERGGAYVKRNSIMPQNYAIAVGGPITIDNSDVDAYSRSGCSILCYTDNGGVQMKDEAGIKETSGITLKNLTVAEGGSVQSIATSDAGTIATTFATGKLILDDNDFPTNASKKSKIKSK